MRESIERIERRESIERAERRLMRGGRCESSEAFERRETGGHSREIESMEIMERREMR